MLQGDVAVPPRRLVAVLQPIHVPDRTLAGALPMVEHDDAETSVRMKPALVKRSSRVP